MKPYKRHKRHETIAVTFIKYKNATHHQNLTENPDYDPSKIPQIEKLFKSLRCDLS